MEDEEDCTHEITEWGKCVCCSAPIEYDDDELADLYDRPAVRPHSGASRGCLGRGWYHDGSEEFDAYLKGRAVKPCPHC